MMITDQITGIADLNLNLQIDLLVLWQH
jgi:hypothetical protein